MVPGRFMQFVDLKHCRWESGRTSVISSRPGLDIGLGRTASWRDGGRLGLIRVWILFTSSRIH